jgi:hypothetical protein
MREMLVREHAEVENDDRAVAKRKTAWRRPKYLRFLFAIMPLLVFASCASRKWSRYRRVNDRGRERGVFPNHQSKLMTARITLKNTDFRVSARLDLN